MDEPFCPQHSKSTDFLILVTNYYLCKGLNIRDPICLDPTVFLEVTHCYVAFQNFFYGFTSIELSMEICIIT